MIGFFVVFLSNGENLYGIYLNVDLFYDICNTINEPKDKITVSHWCFQSNLVSINWLKKFFSNFICVIINYEFCVLTLQMHYILFISVFGGNKINNYLLIEFSMYQFFLRLFMMSFKHGLISSRYSLVDNALFFGWGFV